MKGRTAPENRLAEQQSDSEIHLPMTVDDGVVRWGHVTAEAGKACGGQMKQHIVRWVEQECFDEFST